MARTDNPGPYALDTLAATPVPELFTRDADVLKARYVAWFEAETGRTLYPAQVEMFLIETLAYAMSLLGSEAQIAAEEHLVAKASIDGLLAMAPNRSTQRLPAATARTTMRFSIAQVRPINLVIGQDTRISAGSGGLIFTTSAPAIIAAGALFADAPAVASTEGEAGNGFLPGQITTLLDPVPGVSAANIATSEGGADIEDVELYRLRMANAFDAISPGGGLGWYTETAMGVSSAIIDVAVIRPEPCYVDIYPLTAAGAAGTALRDQVKAAFNTKEALEIRFGDEVTIKAAVAVPIAPVLTIRLRGVTTGAQALAAATANIELVAWREQLGVAVAPSAIEEKVKAALKAAGRFVVDVEVTDMTFEQLGEEEFAALTLITAEDVVLEVVGD